jgi:(p)ppGpp synthase/HD superfamily hydrolase
MNAFVVLLGGSDVTPLTYAAHHFAVTAHEGQKRKYTGEPYIKHPIAVMRLVESVPHTEAMLCAALLHDTVEDTDAQIGTVRTLFGTEVADLVEMLSDVSKPEDGNRAVRKAIDRTHTAKASPAAKTIKLADLIDNTKSIVAHDPKFAKVYLEEKRLLLEALTEGDATLLAMAREQIGL